MKTNFLIKCIFKKWLVLGFDKVTLTGYTNSLFDDLYYASSCRL